MRSRLAWRTVAWLLWYVKVATVVLLMTEYNRDRGANNYYYYYYYNYYCSHIRNSKHEMAYGY